MGVKVVIKTISARAPVPSPNSFSTGSDVNDGAAK